MNSDEVLQNGLTSFHHYHFSGAYSAPSWTRLRFTLFIVVRLQDSTEGQKVGLPEENTDPQALLMLCLSRGIRHFTWSRTCLRRGRRDRDGLISPGCRLRLHLRPYGTGYSQVPAAPH